MAAPIVITGMHRSGTSLLASMLQRAGVHLGDRLLGPGPGNRRGYFEDLDFVELHEDLLTALGTSMYLKTPPAGAVPAALRRRAEALVAARAARPAWGWKDPRTTLFLDLWDDVAPGAWYAFVYRRPAEVVSSLRRRRDAALYRSFPGAALLERLGAPRFRADRALAMWRAYNERLVRFAERRPERCFVMRHDALAEAVPAAIARLRDEGLPVEVADVAALIDPALSRTDVPPAIERLCRRDGTSAALMRRLDALAG